MSDENGIKWLVEERDRLKARCEVLENELVRRDAAGPPKTDAFFVQVFDEEARATRYRGGQKAIADMLVDRLAKEIVYRSTHKISVMPDKTLRLYCYVDVVKAL